MIPAPAHRPGPSIYRRRRVVATLVAACSLTLGGLGARSALAGPGGEPASAAGAGRTLAQRSVVARSGDTLWSIARTAYRADTDAGSNAVSFPTYLDEVVERNGGTELQVGDEVVLP